MNDTVVRGTVPYKFQTNTFGSEIWGLREDWKF